MNNLDDAINATGPKVPMAVTLTDSDVRASLSRQDVLIAKIEPMRVRIANALDKIEKGITVASPLIGLAAPQAIPFLVPTVGALDLIEGLLRSKGELDEDTLNKIGTVIDGFDKALNPEAPPADTAPVTPDAVAAAKAIAAHSPHHVPHDELPPGHTDTSHHAKPPHGEH